MRVPVVFWNANPDAIARGYWDQSVIEDVLARRSWLPAIPVEYIDEDEAVVVSSPETGAVVIVPARHNADSERVWLLSQFLGLFPFSVVVLTGDEEWTYPWMEIAGKNRAIWHMTGRPAGGEPRADRYLGSGYSPGTREALHGLSDRRRYDYAFLGQVTHERRSQCIEGVTAVAPEWKGFVYETAGFTQGLPRDQYLRVLAETKIAPCPAGPESPDSFRLYEALEAGCVPVIDTQTRHGNASIYWGLVTPGAPMPTQSDWRSFPGDVPHLVAEWPRWAARCAAWWLGEKRDLAWSLDDTVRRLSGSASAPIGSAEGVGPDDLITVIVPTSPIPRHPSTEILEATLASVRAHLPTAEIIVTCDGVNPAHEDRRADYDEYLRRVTVLAQREWSNVLPLIHDQWGHQANSARAALAYVRTPLILFVEHDTPLTPLDLPVEWAGLSGAIIEGHFDMIRLHHETAIGDYHAHMMLGRGHYRSAYGHEVCVERTFQWSQRPHLASRAFYDRILAAHFPPDGRDMIEVPMHGVCASSYSDYGEPGWAQYRLGVYVPHGDNIQRSLNLDGARA